MSPATGGSDQLTIERSRYGYDIDGTFYRRVTTFCGGIPKPWLGSWAAKTVAEFAVDHKEQWENLGKKDAVKLLKGSPWSKRDDAGDRGSAVHAAAEHVARGEPVPVGTLTTDDERECAFAVRDFLREMDPKILGVEVTVFSPSHGYAGTFDLYCEADGLRWLLDWKTSKSVYAEHAVQLAAYYNAEYAAARKKPVPGVDEKWTATRKEWGPDLIDRMGVVHVQPGTAKLHPVRYDERLWTTFRAAKHTKMFTLDTDDYRGKTPRFEVFDDPTIEVSIEPEEAAV